MAKALRIDAGILDTATPVPQAAQVKVPLLETPAPAGTGKKGSPKGQIPLQVRWPRSEVKAAKLAAVGLDFPTMSDFMLACFHEYMKTRNQP
jgi:hypothetical protein